MLKKQRKQTDNNRNIPGNKNGDAISSNPNSNVYNHNNNNKNSNRAEKKPKTVYSPCETCGITTIPQKNATTEPIQPTDHLPGTEHRKDKIKSKKEPTKLTRKKLLRLQPKFKLKMPRIHSGAAIDKPEVTHLTLQPIPKVGWQQPHETHVTKIHNVLITETNKNTYPNSNKEKM